MPLTTPTNPSRQDRTTRRSLALSVAVASVVLGLGGTVFAVASGTAGKGACHPGRKCALASATSTSSLVPTTQATYYMSPTGSDTNPGTFSSPWRTLKASLPKLAPGSTLYLTEGTYFENSLEINERGTSDAPITIASYPGESAIIDGGLPEFYTPNASSPQWQLVDPSIGLWRSARTYGGSFVGAWLLDADIQLLQYRSVADLESTYYGPFDGSKPLYMGPGVDLQPDGHIYVRLAPNPRDLYDAKGRPIPAPVPDEDPNDHKMSVFTADTLFDLSGAANIHFEHLTLEGPTHIFSASGSTDISVTHCRIRFGTYGLVAENGAQDWSLTRNTWDNGFPSWTYWTDVKDQDEEDEGYPEFQSDAITESGTGLVGFKITGNVIRDTMEGILVKDGSHDDEIARNYIVRAHDDGIQFWHGAGGNLDVSDNMLWHVGGGIGVVSSDANPAGPIYFHNNVVDDSIVERVGRPGNNYSTRLPSWMVWSPFTSHGGSAALWFFMYNNTIVSRRSAAYTHNATGPAEIDPSTKKRVFNNIIYSLDDRIAERDDQVAQGSDYNGNDYWQARRSPGKPYPLFYNFGNGRSYSTLALFQRAKLGWETSGLEVDPRFNPASLARASFHASHPSALWRLYMPSSRRLLTPGYNLSRTGWPGSASLTYRGAIGPSLGQPDATT